MDDVQTILTAISTVGFPIVACIAMFWLYTKILPILTQLSQNMQDTKNAMEDMKETMNEVKISLNLFNQNFQDIFKRLASLEGKKE